MIIFTFLFNVYNSAHYINISNRIVCIMFIFCSIPSSVWLAGVVTSADPRGPHCIRHWPRTPPRPGLQLQRSLQTLTQADPQRWHRLSPRLETGRCRGAGRLSGRSRQWPLGKAGIQRCRPWPRLCPCTRSSRCRWAEADSGWGRSLQGWPREGRGSCDNFPRGRSSLHSCQPGQRPGRLLLLSPDGGQ